MHRQLKIDLLYDLAVPHLGLDPEEAKSDKVTCDSLYLEQHKLQSKNMQTTQITVKQ